MPHKDPDARRKATREAVKRHRVGKGSTVGKLAEQVKAAADLPEPPSREFLIRALGVQAMEGNVPAIRLLLEEYRRDGNEDAQPQQSKVVELAARRASRAS